MQRTTLSGIILGLLLFGFSGVVFASAADELRDRAKHLRKEASAIAERGNKELVGRLESEAVWMLEAAARQGDRPDINAAGELRERGTALRKEASAMAERGSKDLGGRLESESVWMFAAAKRLEIHAQAENLEKATRRIQHLRVAAENLKLAESHDLARELLKNAEAMERQVQEAKAHLAAETQKPHSGEHKPRAGEQGPGADPRAEIERLRAEIKELRERAEKR